MLEQPEEQKHEEREHFIAAIDLGSNSFHMVIAKQSHGELRIIETLGEKVQLAAGIDDRGKLTKEAQQRALDCLDRFRQRIRLFETSQVQIVGTNALRVAKNRKQFIAKAQEVIGFPIEVISGREEARLIYLGVSHSMADDEGNRLVIDIGGGSTEFVIGERFEPILLESLHMGCISYRDRYFNSETLSKNQFEKAQLEASRELINIKKPYCEKGWIDCVGSSGSVKAVSNALIFTGLSEGEITLPALKALKKQLLSLGSVSKLQNFGIKADRASTFSAGFAILYAAFKVLNIEQMSYNSGALREGLLYDIVGRNTHEDVRARTIVSLQQRYHIDVAQSERVEATVQHAFEQVAEKWKLLSDENQNLLHWAARIYELGFAISHSQYHKHGAYLLHHSDLPGFTNRIKTLLAMIIRLHRRRFTIEVLNELEKNDAKTMLRLCILFRLAIILTANRISKETEFVLRASGPKHLSIEMGADWESEYPLTMASLLDEKAQLARIGITLDVL